MFCPFHQNMIENDIFRSQHHFMKGAQGRSDIPGAYPISMNAHLLLPSKISNAN